VVYTRGLRPTDGRKYLRGRVDIESPVVEISIE
jgi:hypothetical protein